LSDLKKRVAFQTLGCKLNFAESSTMARSFPEDAYQRVSPDSEADIYIINTCSVTDTADRKCRQAIRKVISKNPGAFVAVVGCYAQLNPGAIAEIEGVDLVLGTDEKFNISSYIENIEKKKAAEIHSCENIDTAGFNASWSANDRTRSFLKVQDGCDYHCSYCTVPLARGASRNQPVKEIVSEAKLIVESGVKEIVLTGVNVGDFGKTTGESLEELLKELCRVKGLERLRLSSIEPNLLTNDIIRLIASEPVLMPHIHMPLQSGNNHILGLMKRRYRREVFRERINTIRELLPEAAAGADVIVGFPGETEEEFTDTFEFLSSIPFTYLHVFAFSPRPGTPAAEMPGKVTEKVKENRSRQLIKLSESHKNIFMRENAGEIRNVLFEKKNFSGMIAGFTENYIKTMVPYNKSLSGNICRVRMTTVNEDGTMNGELID
jgi:threonylcarbamoyladenosine tRNA methylthiotransferase MtaB